MIQVVRPCPSCESNDIEAAGAGFQLVITDSGKEHVEGFAELPKLLAREDELVTLSQRLTTVFRYQSDPSARPTLTSVPRLERVTRTSQGLQHTSQSWTNVPRTSSSICISTSSPQ